MVACDCTPSKCGVEDLGLRYTSAVRNSTKAYWKNIWWFPQKMPSCLDSSTHWESRGVNHCCFFSIRIRVPHDENASTIPSSMAWVASDLGCSFIESTAHVSRIRWPTYDLTILTWKYLKHLGNIIYLFKIWMHAVISTPWKNSTKQTMTLALLNPSIEAQETSLPKRRPVPVLPGNKSGLDSILRLAYEMLARYL